MNGGKKEKGAWKGKGKNRKKEEENGREERNRRERGGRNITIFISLIQFWKLICKILSVIIIALKCVRLSSQNPRPIVFCG